MQYSIKYFNLDDRSFEQSLFARSILTIPFLSIMSRKHKEQIFEAQQSIHVLHR